MLLFTLQEKKTESKTAETLEKPIFNNTNMTDLVQRIQQTPRSKSKVVHVEMLNPYNRHDLPRWKSEYIVDGEQLEEARGRQYQKMYLSEEVIF